MNHIFSKQFYSSARKVAFVFVAAVFAFSFSACSDDDDFADAIAYYQNEESGIGKITLAFYDDSTFVLHKKYEHNKKSSDGKKVVEDYDIATGTYTGIVTQDGSVTCTYKKAVSDVPQQLMNSRGLFGDKEETLTNDDYPLSTLLPPIEESYTISGGKITYKVIVGIELNNAAVKDWLLELTKQ